MFYVLQALCFGSGLIKFKVGKDTCTAEGMRRMPASETVLVILVSVEHVESEPKDPAFLWIDIRFMSG